MPFDGGNLLAEVRKVWPKLGLLLEKHETAINTTAQNSAVDAVGKIAPPDPPDSVNVSTMGEFMQISVNHAAPVQKGVQYISEISTNPQFSQPIMHDHGASRSPVPFHLPSKDGDGNVLNYYVRTRAQYQGSDPSEPTNHGGQTPMAVTLGGTTQWTMNPSTGAGTGPANGQGSAGIGPVVLRPSMSPKRAV